MNIRSKLLILLLVISIGPAFFLRWMAHNAMSELSEDLAEQSRSSLVNKARFGLKQLVDDHALVLKTEIALLDLALEEQARVVEEALNSNASSSDNYFLASRGMMAREPQEAKPSSIHILSKGPGAGTPLSVTHERAAFVARGVRNSARIMQDTQRLASVTPVLKNLEQKIPGLVLWQFTVLENGLYSIFPGHGNIPMGFHPDKVFRRYSNRYSEVKSFWNTAEADPFTRQPILSRVLPIHGQNGQLIGFTGTSVALKALLHQNPAHLPYKGLRSWVVRGEKDSGHPGIRIVASEWSGADRMHHGHWRLPKEKQWIESTNSSALLAIATDIAAGTNNISRMAMDNQMYIWAYARIAETGETLLFAIPEKEVTRVAEESRTYILDRIQKQMVYTGAVLSIVVAIVILLALVISRHITLSITRIVDVVHAVAKGDFKARATVNSSDELGQLARTFNELVPALEDQVRLQETLDLASEVQGGLLPKDAVCVSEFDVASETVYCDETGGDYYDILVDRIHPEWVGFVVGDVSGHGLPAALLMASVRGFMRGRTRVPASLGDVVSDVNRLVSKDTYESGSFITMFLLVFDRRTKHFSWIRAGHDPAMVYDTSTDTFTELKGDGLPLGVLEDTEYTETVESPLSPCQMLLIGTDGIWETHSASGEMYGKERFRMVVRENAHKPASGIHKAVMDDLEAFRNGAKQEDDVTFMVIKTVGDCQDEVAP